MKSNNELHALMYAKPPLNTKLFSLIMNIVIKKIYMSILNGVHVNLVLFQIRFLVYLKKAKTVSLDLI